MSIKDDSLVVVITDNDGKEFELSCWDEPITIGNYDKPKDKAKKQRKSKGRCDKTIDWVEEETGECYKKSNGSSY